MSMKPEYGITKHLPGSVTEMNQDQRREAVRIYLDCWKQYFGVTTDAAAIREALKTRKNYRRNANDKLNEAAPLRKWLIEYKGLRDPRLPELPFGQLDWDVMNAGENPIIKAVREKYDRLVRESREWNQRHRNTTGYFFDHLYPRTKIDVKEPSKMVIASLMFDSEANPVRVAFDTIEQTETFAEAHGLSVDFKSEMTLEEATKRNYHY